MRMIDQCAFERPHVSAREPPVVTSERVEIERGIAFDAAGLIDIGVEIAHGQSAQRSEYGLAPMQSGIARARDGAPTAILAVEEQHVVEAIDGFEREQQR